MDSITQIPEKSTRQMSLEEIFQELGETLQARFVMTQILNYIMSLAKLGGSFNYTFQVPELPKIDGKIQRWGTIIIRGSKVGPIRQRFGFWFKPRRLEVFWTAQAGQVIKLLFEQDLKGDWKMEKVVGATEQMEGNMFQKLKYWAGTHGESVYHAPLDSLQEVFS